METPRPCAINQPEIHMERKNKSIGRDIEPRLSGRRSAPSLTKRAESDSKSILRCELEDALVQAGVTKHLAADTRAEHGFEHVLLEPANDRVALEHVQERGMAFENLRAPIFVIDDEFRHVAFAVANVRKPLRAFGDCVSLRLRFQSRSLLFENVIEQLLRRV